MIGWKEKKGMPWYHQKCHKVKRDFYDLLVSVFLSSSPNKVFDTAYLKIILFKIKYISEPLTCDKHTDVMLQFPPRAYKPTQQTFTHYGYNSACLVKSVHFGHVHP